MNSEHVTLNDSTKTIFTSNSAGECKIYFKLESVIKQWFRIMFANFQQYNIFSCQKVFNTIKIK